mmetsp:Transcript_37166/g.87440  ORF Transcript_37166/g.87440 Transcript_37166/m.87440 type:complete len:274 (+) Transcript_37166:121-942(+)
MSHASADMAHSVSKTAKMAFPPLKFHQPSEQDASAHTQAAHEATKQAHEAALSPGDWTAVPASHDPTNLPLAMARSVPNKQQRLWGWSIKDMMNFTQPSQAPEHAEATKALAAPAESKPTDEHSWGSVFGFIFCMAVFLGGMYALFLYLRWRKENGYGQEPMSRNVRYEPIQEEEDHDRAGQETAELKAEVNALQQRLAIAEKRTMFTQVHVDDLQKHVIGLQDRVAHLERSPGRRASFGDGSDGEFATGLYSFVRQSGSVRASGSSKGPPQR